MRLLFIGDVVGRSGRSVLTSKLPDLRRRWNLDFVIVNGENAAGGFGITEAICDEFLGAGADCVTLGNHAFDQREALVFIGRQPRLLRPAPPFPPPLPGTQHPQCLPLFPSQYLRKAFPAEKADGPMHAEFSV